MPRKAELDRRTDLELRIPESIRGWLDLTLWSELENRVPLGAYSNWFLERIREFREQKSLDLRPFGIEGEVRGEPVVIDQLRAHLALLQKETK